MVVVAVGNDRSGVDGHILADEHVVDTHLGNEVVEVRPTRRRAVGDGRCVAGVDEPAAVREFVSVGAFVGRLTDHAVEVTHQHRRRIPSDRVEMVEYQFNSLGPRSGALMVQMRVQTQQVVAGVAVTEAGPGRHAGIGGVPADAARLGGLFREPEGIRCRTVEALGLVADGRVLPAGVDGVTRVTDPLVAVEQHL